MFGSLIKRKLTDNQVANIFVNAIFEATDNGFEDLCFMINNDIVFGVTPNISQGLEGHFNLIVLAANMTVLESTFEADEAERVEDKIFEKLANIYSISIEDAKLKVKSYQSFLNRINHPSKNIVYAMSKGIFHSYKLAQYQKEEYFRTIGNPNPLFLKRLDEVMELFLWDWDLFFKKYKIG